MFGLLNVDKREGETSRDVVNQVQRWVRPHKVGHAGTLDPLATGVLVLCLGQATRLIPYVQQMRKHYHATFLLGQQSETEDIEGTVVALDSPPRPTEQAVKHESEQFIGEISQRPPAFSAKKVSGKRAYALARAGQTFTLEAKQVTIYDMRVIRYEYPRLEMAIACGSGTYVRSLGRDLAERLGTAAVMSALRRTAIGPFTAEKACDLTHANKPDIHRHLLPPVLAVGGMPQVTLNAMQWHRIRQGQFIEATDLAHVPPAVTDLAAFRGDGDLVAILTRRGNAQWGASRNFARTS